MPAATFHQLAMHPIKFRFFLWSRLPSAFFSGVKVKEINAQTCKTSIKYRWFVRNPFKSTYFACLAMAAEMSTGALAMAALYKRKPSVSMLLVKVTAEYYKKAVGNTEFICEMGEELAAAVDRAIHTGESQTVEAISKGYDQNGILIAQFSFVWSFKSRK